MRLLTLIAALMFLFAGNLWANNPMIRTAADEYTWQSARAGSPSVQQVVLTFDANDSKDWIYLNQIRFDGPNADDFRIVGAGNCEAGDPLYPGEPTCVLNIQYTPSFAYAETAHLTVTCSILDTGPDATPQPGLPWTTGFAMECADLSVGRIPLIGLVAISAAPMLDGKILILLAALLGALGIRFARKKYL